MPCCRRWTPPGCWWGTWWPDWVKGRARHELPGDLRAGVALHRRIDTFTDTHPLVEYCAGLLEERWNRYAPVLVDIFFDHALSVEWGRFCAVERATFIRRTYAALREHLHLLPERAQYGANALLADDWFSCYATLEGIGLSLTRLSKRLGHGIELAPAVRDFAAHREAFWRVFEEFFPALKRNVEAES